MRDRSVFGFVAAAALAASLVACDKKPEGGAQPTATASGSATPSAGGPALSGAAAAGKTIFDGQCQACHSIGAGDRTGPDLKDLSKRRQKDWVVKFVKDPIAMTKDDPVGKELLLRGQKHLYCIAETGS